MSGKDKFTIDRLPKIAEMINEELPAKWGFILLAFPFGEKGRLHYIANGKREDALNVMREFIEKNKNPNDFGKHV